VVPVVPTNITSNATLGNATLANATTTLTYPQNVTNITVIPAVVPLVMPLNLTNATLFHLIPEAFFVDKDGKNTTNRDCIVLQTKDSEMVSCNNLGNLTISKGKINPDNLWIPVRANQSLARNENRVTLRSHWGGYIGFENDTSFSFDCLQREPSDRHLFTVERGNATTVENAIALKTDRGYLGVFNSTVLLVKDLNNSVYFVPPTL
jgi:hypothetical protein